MRRPLDDDPNSMTMDETAPPFAETLNVQRNGSLTPDFCVIPNRPTALLDVRFDASGSRSALGDEITDYSWDFGDGTSKAGGGGDCATQFSEVRELRDRTYG